MPRRTRFAVYPTLLVFLVMGAVPAATQTCEYYGGASSFPFHELGLGWNHDLVPIVANGNYIYLFDNGKLDVCNMEDPYQIQDIDVQPPITAVPPVKLIRVGDDRLYALHADSVGIIDISTRDTPTLVATRPGLGSDKYLGEWAGHGFFLAGTEILVYSFADPDDPQLVTTWQSPLTVTADPRLCSSGLGRLYLFTPEDINENYGYELHIIDVTDPAAPTLAAHYTCENAPSFELSFTLQGHLYDAFVAEDMMYVHFYDGILGIDSFVEGNTTAHMSLADPDLPVVEWFAGTVYYGAAANGLEYGCGHDSYFGRYLQLGPQRFAWDSEWSSMVLTDRAVVFVYDHPEWPNDAIITIPRQCDPPLVVADSLEHSLTLNLLTGGFDIEVTWRTVGWTDPQLDQLTLTDGRRNPPEAQIGTVVRTEGEEPVLQPDGTWLHKMTYGFETCVSPASYNYEVQSERTGLTDSEEGLAKIKFCPRESSGGGGPE